MRRKKKTPKFQIGDAVVHERGSPIGIVISNLDNGLLKIKWETHVVERVPPEELHLLKTQTSLH